MADTVLFILVLSKTDLTKCKPTLFPDVLRMGGREAAMISFNISEFKQPTM